MKVIKRVFWLVAIVMFLINAKNIARYFFPIKYSDYIVKYSERYDLDPYLVAAVIKTESNFQEKAKSNKNAYGLMQITGNTAEWAAEKMEISHFSTVMLYEPEFNIKMGCWYLDNLRDEFDDNMEVVLAAYNGGRGNVQKWLNSSEHSVDGKNLHYIPFKETDKYVKKVKVNYRIYKYLYGENINTLNISMDYAR